MGIKSDRNVYAISFYYFEKKSFRARLSITRYLQVRAVGATTAHEVNRESEPQSEREERSQAMLAKTISIFNPFYLHLISQ